MISISFSDMLLVDEFKGLREIDLLPVEIDSKVLPYLYEVGMDTNKGYQVVVNKHRNKQNKIVIGFLWAGEIRIDSAFRESPFCSATDRIIMSSKKDFSLTQELCQLQGGGLNYSKFSSEEDERDEKDYLELELYEKDYVEVSSYLKTLEDVIFNVRGSPYNEWGSLKTLEQYLESVK